MSHNEKSHRKLTLSLRILAVLCFACLLTGHKEAEAQPGDMVMVPAGDFWTGSSDGEIMAVKEEFGSNRLYKHYPFDEEKPKTKIYLKSFYIDRYEVTNRQFARFVKATKHKPPRHWIGGHYKNGADDYPVLYVSQEDAKAYAKWRGKRLPTELEWVKASRGSDGRVFPWGNDFDPYKAATADSDLKLIFNALCSPFGANTVGLAKEDMSPYGVMDMAGNVREWTSTKNPDRPSKVVVKGASWVDLHVNARSAHREYINKDHVSHIIGFRCVKDIE